MHNNFEKIVMTFVIIREENQKPEFRPKSFKNFLFGQVSSRCFTGSH